VAVHQSPTIPVALNSFGLWLALMIGLTLFNYGYPVASLLARSDTSVPAIPVGGPQR
jgi:cytochrome c oxidase subunit 1